MGNPLTVDYAVGTQIPLALFQGVPLNVIVGAPSGGPVDASTVTYTPGDPLDWPIPPPGDVATALDELANVRGSYAENPAAVAVTTTSLLQISALAPQKSGIYLVWAGAQLDGSGSVGAVATCTLLLDAVQQGQAQGVGYAPGIWSLTPNNFALVAVNRALPHTWAARWDSNSAAQFSIQQQRAKLMLLEL